MDNSYKNIEEHSANKKCKILIIFHDMLINKKFSSVVTELFIRGKKLSISLVFITSLYFKFPRDVRPNITHCFIMNFSNK